MTYCFDTSAFIGAWVRKYPPDVVPGFWDRLDALIQEGRVLWNVEVIAELEKQKDDLHKWVKDRSIACRALDQEVQQKTKEILAQYPLMLNTKGSRPTADPFIVAQAAVSDAVLVTEEGPSLVQSPHDCIYLMCATDLVSIVSTFSHSCGASEFD